MRLYRASNLVDWDVHEVTLVNPNQKYNKQKQKNEEVHEAVSFSTYVFDF